MELLLEGKSVAQNVAKDFNKRIEKLKKIPYVAVLGIEGDEASLTYVKRIQKNCEKYEIKFIIKIAKDVEEFKINFKEIIGNPEITGIMCQQPLPKELFELVNTIPLSKDIEGITHLSLGKLFVGEKNINIPCTSRAVIETLDYYNIDLTGKNVVVVRKKQYCWKAFNSTAFK